MLIVFEGIDGTGKSTQASALAERLKSEGHLVVLSREPTDGKWGKMLRESATTGRLTADEELAAFISDRKEHVEQLIRPSLLEGKIVILDRYYFSTMAYQGLRGFDRQEVRRMNEVFAPIPDLLLIFNLRVDQAMERIGARDGEGNFFEKRETLESCRETFLSLTDEVFAETIDASLTPQEVTDQVWSVVSRKLL